MPIVDAQATGRAVITSNLSPMKDIAGEGTFLVDPYDTDSIRNAILTIISDTELREATIRKGLENVRKYSFDRFCDQFSTIYDTHMGHIVHIAKDT